MHTAGGATTVPTPAPTLPEAVGGAVLALPRGAGEPPVTLPRGPAREAARRELSKQMYHENDPSWFQRVLDTFWERVGRLFDAASTAAPGGTLGLLVIVAAVLAVLGALWWRLGTPHRRPVSAPALFGARPRDAAGHRAAAGEHAARGHWDQAVQERMRALIRALEERALLDPHPGRTADEAATEAARALPAHTGRLHTAAQNFDDVTYGGRTATEESYRQLTELDLDLERTGPRLTSTSTGHRDRNDTSGNARGEAAG